MIHVAVAILSRRTAADWQERQICVVFTGASTEADTRARIATNSNVIRMIVEGWSLDLIIIHPVTAEELLSDRDVLSQVNVALCGPPRDGGKE